LSLGLGNLVNKRANCKLKRLLLQSSNTKGNEKR